MLGCHFGRMFQVTAAGGSYQDGLTVVVQGCPPAMAITEQEIYGDLLLRKPGADELSSPRKEPDLPIIYTGVNAADTVENAEAIAAAAAAAETMLTVGYSLRSHAGLRRLRELVRSGVCGNIVGGRGMVGTYFTLMCATTPYRMTEPNALITDYTHLLDYLGLLIGPIVRVSAESATLGELAMMPRPNLFSAILTHESGALSQFHADYIQHPQRSLAEVFGDRATLMYDFQSYELRIYHRDRPGYEAETAVSARDDIYRVQIADFLAQIHGDRVPICTAEEGVAALRVATAAVQSAAEHRAVEV